MLVLGIGHCTLDQIGVLERFVEPEGRAEFLQYSEQGGGSVATAMVALSRWGVRCRFVGKVGDDSRGHQIIRTIADEGVDASQMIRQKKAVSQLSFILVEQGSGKKQTMTMPGNVTPIQSEELDISVLDGVTHLLVDTSCLYAVDDLLAAARERGVVVILDGTRIQPHLADSVSKVDYLVASERFASQFAGVGELHQLCNSLLTKGPHTVVVTLGNEGAVGMAKDDERLHRVPAHVVDVVDSTGAGDVFHGAVIYGVLQDWPLKKTLRFSNVAAGLSCLGLGGRSAIPSLENVLEHVED